MPPRLVPRSAWLPQAVTLECASGAHVVQGYRSEAAPGLAVTPMWLNNQADEREWSVTHVASGRIVAPRYFEPGGATRYVQEGLAFEEAIRFAVELAKSPINWQLSMGELTATDELKRWMRDQVARAWHRTMGVALPTGVT